MLLLMRSSESSIILNLQNAVKRFAYSAIASVKYFYLDFADTNYINLNHIPLVCLRLKMMAFVVLTLGATSSE
mgnify:CR=1 FL=1